MLFPSFVFVAHFLVFAVTKKFNGDLSKWNTDAVASIKSSKCIFVLKTNRYYFLKNKKTVVQTN